MQNVRLHIAGDGEVWVLSKCRRCGEVDKHALQAAASGPVRCRKCEHPMDMAGASIEALESEVAKLPGPPDRGERGAPTGDVAPSAARVSALLELEGLSGALAAINGSVPHRYTGIFLKEGPLLRNVALHDKTDATPELWAPFPLGQSFCSLVIATGDPLTVAQAQVDVREDVRNHPAGDLVQAYCGVPFVEADGRVAGTLCHFDQDRIETRVDFVYMLQLPALLRPYLPDGRPAPDAA